jgi:hypothetical protein
LPRDPRFRTVSPPRKASALPRVLRLRAPLHHPGRLQRCHASLGTGPTSPPRRALALTHGPRLQTTPSLRGGLRRRHVSHGSLRAMGRRDKERLSYNGMQQCSCVSKTRPRVTKAPTRRAGKRRYYDLQTVQTSATTPCYSAVPHS